MIPVLILALAMVVLSASYSGLETGIYRLSRLRLRLRAERGALRYAMLSKAMRDEPGLLLSLLVANNLANYLATSSITYLFIAHVGSEGAAGLLATSVVAPLLFVFGESLPKNIFLYRADALAGWLGPLLFVTHQVLTWSGIVPLLKLFSYLFSRLIGSPIPSKKMLTSPQSRQTRAILRDTQEEGILSPVQTEIVDRIINIPSLRLGAVIVPLGQVRAVELRSNRAAVLAELEKHAFTRLLVWDNNPMDIIGFVDIYEVLGSDEPFDGLDAFVKPIRTLDAGTLVIDAIDTMRREELKIVLVTRHRGRRAVPVGIVTMKDLVEELMGELAEW